MPSETTTELRRLGKALEHECPGLADAPAMRAADALEAGVALLDGASSKRLARLITSELPAVVAIAVVAATRADRVGQRASQAACTRLDDDPPRGLAELVLQALAASHVPWVAVRVLHIADPSWLGDGRGEAVLEFLHARAQRGEGLTADDVAGVDAEVLRHVRSLGSPTVLDRWAPVLREDESPERRPSGTPRDPAAGLGALARIGRRLDLAAPPLCTVFDARAAVLATLERALTADPPRSVLVVGEPGSGRSTLARRALAARAGDGWRAFEATAAEVNAGMSYVGELDGRVREMVDAMRGKRIAWLFPGLQEAVGAGQYRGNPNGLLDALLGPVQRGEITLVGIVTPAAHALLLRERPAADAAFEVVRVAVASPADTLAVARDWATETDVEATRETLERAQELADAYLARTAAPGRVLRLLRQAAERAARDGDGGITGAGLLATLSDATGLPTDMLDPQTPMRVDAERDALTARVLGQPEAVEALVERLALIKAGMTDPTRPLGVLLFVGPTGTGKTELAKALAQRLFGAADRLVRLDMSEFQTPDSVERVLADAAVDGHGSPLIAAVRAQPFSVVLLDEFEKAHPRVWDLFLALFDDGRLTDARGSVTDFRQCVVIVTSNAGSALPAGRGLGFAGADGTTELAEGGVQRALRATFRPELLNRFDRIVTFRPLGRDVMRTLLEAELGAVLGRRGLRVQPWAIEWDAAALDLLVERGFSAALGARPLKRAVERHLLVPLAEAVVGRAVPAGDQFLFVGVRDGEIDVRFVDPDAEAPPPPVSPEPAADGDALAGVRALALEPDAGPGARGLLLAVLDDVRARVGTWSEAKDEALARMHEPGFWETADDREAVLGRIELLDRLQAATATAGRLAGRLGARPAASVAGLLAVRLHVLDAALRGLDDDAPSVVAVTVTPSPGTGERGEAWAETLRAMYRGWADARGTRMEAGLTCGGLGATVLLMPEGGLHVLEEPDGRSGFDRVGATVAVAGEMTAEIVRRYRREPSPLVRDTRTGTRTGRLDRVLAGAFDLL